MSDSTDREIAIASYNRAQDLLYRERTPAEEHELLESATTSRRHWRLVGGAQEYAVSDWLMSRVYALNGEPDLAIEFALGAMSHDQTGFPAWLKASLLEGAARAYKSAGNTVDCERYKSLAQEQLAKENNPADFQVIADQMADL